MRALDRTAACPAPLPFIFGHHERRRLRAALTRRLQEKAERYHREAARLRSRGDFTGATTLECAAARLGALVLGEAGINQTA
ncbi:MAG: hypothetical protein VX640_00690 [Pseudomonadota bacterium]|nr:hypothetical protein [Pseudomonadota bacterium]